MLSQNRTFFAFKRKLISLNLVLVVPFILQIFAVVGLVGYLSFKNGQKTVNDLANQLLNQAGQHVDGHLDSYLSLPQKLNQLNAIAIAEGQLDLNDPIACEQYFWRQAKIFQDLSYIAYTLPDGRESGAGRWLDGQTLLTFEHVTGGGTGKARDYLAGPNGDRARLLQSYDYDPLTLEAYQAAVQAGKPIWGEIFTLDAVDVQVTKDGETLEEKSPTSNIGYQHYFAAPARQPIYNAEGKLIGVAVVDMLLTNINQFLANLNVSPSTQIFIMERDGLLVGSSTDTPILQTQDGKTTRLNILNSADPLVRGVGEELQSRFKSFKAIQGTHNLSFTYDGQRQFIQVSPWQDNYGLDWLLVITVPESDFMSQIYTNTRITICLCLAALVIATVLGIYTSRWITHPVLRLNQASKAIAQGELDQTVAPSNITELGDLAIAFNRMGQQLRESFDALETTNEQLEQRVEERTAELRETLVELQSAHAQILQSEKMSSLGQLVAGVAHEINNPVNFIYGNLSHVREYVEDLLGYIRLYEKHYPDPNAEIQAEAERIDLKFLREDSFQILNSMEMGTDRIRQIVRSLQNFSRTDESELKEVDIHEGIESTLLILQHRLKSKSDLPEIQVIRDYGQLPKIKCYAGPLNQVFMNVLSNAIDALEGNSLDRACREIADNQKSITIRTTAIDLEWAEISIIDNGSGIPGAVQPHIFDPFFTTKPVGKGTGMGLSISYQIIVQRHGGKLECHSTPGSGTEFMIQIPIQQSSVEDFT